MIVIFYYYPSARKRRRELGREGKTIFRWWMDLGEKKEARMKEERERERGPWIKKKRNGMGRKESDGEGSRSNLQGNRRSTSSLRDDCSWSGYLATSQMDFVYYCGCYLYSQRCCNSEAEELRFESDSEFLLFQFRRSAIYFWNGWPSKFDKNYSAVDSTILKILTFHVRIIFHTFLPLNTPTQ